VPRACAKRKRRRRVEGGRHRQRLLGLAFFYCGVHGMSFQVSGVVGHGFVTSGPSGSGVTGAGAYSSTGCRLRPSAVCCAIAGASVIIPGGGVGGSVLAMGGGGVGEGALGGWGVFWVHSHTLLGVGMVQVKRFDGALKASS
jgi:hypothetical protein